MKKILPALLFLISNLTYAQVDLNLNLVAYYPFDGSANDLSGNNIHGVVNNAILTTDRNGQPNSAYYFDGSSSYIQLPYSSLYDFKPNDSFSISVRVLPDQGYSWPAQALVVKSPFSPDFNTSNWNYGAYLLNYKAMTGYAANSVLVGSTSFTGNPSCWYNIVATYKNGVWKLYINGVLEASDPSQSRFILQDGPASKITFGKKGDANGDWYKGKMDEIRIYHRVLNQDEINVLSSCPTAQQFCTGTLSAPIVNIDFGSGASNPGPTLSTIVPGTSTTYNFASYATGNPPAVPIDGDYALVNAVPNNSAWHTGAKDHTGNPNGYMAFFNSAPTPGKFYQQTVNGLCGGTTYEFALWVANVIKPNVLPNAILPNITFQILDPNNQQVIGSLNTGDIPMATSMVWKPYSFSFTLPGNLNSIILVLANNNIGGNAQPGNDLAIDDITFRACGPKTTASFSSNSTLTTLSVNNCNNTGTEVYGNVLSGLNNPSFQWQISDDNGNTFVNIPNATTANYILTNLIPGNYKLRLLSAEAGNISSSSCRFVSDMLSLTLSSCPTPITINTYTPVLDFKSCENKITVEDASSFNTGDTILMIQMKGAVIDSSNTNAFGTITDYKSAGNYEFNYVKSKNGNIIELLNTLTRTYDIPNGKVQIVRVPYYDNAVVTSPLTCLPWDGAKGGVLVLRAKNEIQLNADIDVSGKGLKGGSLGNNLTHASNCNQLGYSYPLGSSLGSPKGEGIAILSTDKLWGRGPLANGGGGGNDHNSGGGGGSNGNAGGKGGYQFEGCGSGPFDNGGLGGKQLAYSNPVNKIFLGGGGGSGHANNQAGFNPDGGNGGGIIIIDAPLITNNGNFSIKADGSNAVTCSSNSNNDNCNEGMGGGGAGGSILIKTSSYTNNTLLSAKGGNGADVSYYVPAAPSSKHGPGGGGSGGTIWLNQSGTPGNLTLDVLTGKNGTNINYGNDARGSTNGQNGISVYNLQLPADGSPFTGQNTIPPNFDFNFAQDICNPKLVKFSTNSTETVSWDFGNGTLMGNIKTHNELYADYGIYTVKLKATYANGCMDSVIKQIPVQLTIDSLITTRDTILCGTTSFQLKGLPALKYCWSPATGLSGSDIQNPVISSFMPKTTYYLNAMLTGPNLVVNGDFSAGNTGFSSDYAYKVQNISTSNYLIDISPVKGNISFSDCRDHTTGNGNMMAIDASPVANQKVWKQIITVNPNTNYAFSCWISSIHPDNPAKLQFYINGNLIGNIFNASTTTCQWQQFYTVWNAGNITSAEIAIVNQNTEGYGNDFALDDISFAELKIIRDSVTIAINEKPEIGFDYTIPSCKSPKLNEIALNEPYPIQRWDWYFGDNTSASGLSPTHSYAKGGAYNIKLIATDINGCKDSITQTIQLDTATAIAAYSGPVCPGGTITLQGAGGTTYEWTSTTPVDDPTGQNTTATLTTNTKFQLKVTDNIGCEDTASVSASVIPKAIFSKPADMQTCKGNSIILNANANPSYQYTWTPADYLSDPNAASPVATPDVSTEYTVHVIEPQCGYDTSFTVKTLISANANVFVLPNAFTPNGDSKNDCFGIRNWGNTTVREFSIYNRWGQKIFETKDPSHCWDGKNKGQLQPSGAYIYVIKALTPCGEVERKGSFMLVR